MQPAGPPRRRASRTEEWHLVPVPAAALTEVFEAYAAAASLLDMLAVERTVERVFRAHGLDEGPVGRMVLTRVFALDRLLREGAPKDWQAAEGPVRLRQEVLDLAASLPLIRWPDGAYGFDAALFRRALDGRGRT